MKILPLFLPHQGCTHQCVYCNQPLVVGPGENREGWRERLESAAYDSREDWEIAFLGGTFSALEPAVMRDNLQFIAPYTKRLGVRGIRISTRPDRVPDDTLTTLKSAGVRTIELGVESLDDAVLRKSARGHTAEDARDACRRVRRHGFILGIHLMCGLPGQPEDSFFQTVDESLALQPDFVRIAPTLVLKGTPLEQLYRRGAYQPLSLEEAIHQCCYAVRFFYRSGVAIARVGLAISDAEGDGVEKIAAGPWHPALRHEVESRLIRETISALLERETDTAYLIIHPKDVSIVLGEGKKNLVYWRKTLNRSISIERDENQLRHTVRMPSGKTFSLFDSTLERTS